MQFLNIFLFEQLLSEQLQLQKKMCLRALRFAARALFTVRLRKLVLLCKETIY